MAARGGRAGAALWAVCAAAWLTGCAAPRAPQADTLSGRLAIRIDDQPPRALSADFELSGSPAAGQLVLSGPLGTTAAQAQWTPGSASLTTGARRTEYPDLDSLAVDALGEHVPIAALFDWLRGRAWSGAAATARVDGEAGFEQLGWQIDLGRWQDGWLQARRSAPPVVTVRIRLERPS